MSVIITKPEINIREKLQLITPEPDHGGWQDYLIPLVSLNAGGVSPPNLAAFGPSGNVYAMRFQEGEELFFGIHILHDMIPGTLLYPHIHWTSDSTSTEVVEWSFEHTSAAGYDTEAFGATSTITLSQAGSGTAWQHMINEATESQAVVCPPIDSLIMCRLARTTTGAHPDDVFGLFIDVHYQSDGSLTKERNAPHTKSNS